MSEHNEARTVAFFPVFYDGVKVNFTIRGGTTLAEAGEDLAVLRDTLASLGTFGLSLKLGTGTEDGGDWDETREGLHWIRGTSYNGKPCAFVYADNAAVQEKLVTVYKHVIPDLPITQEQWDNAPVWDDKGRAPKKDDAGGYLQTFPMEMRFGGKDQGDDKVFNGNRSYWWDAVLNPSPGGVTFDGKPAPSVAAAAAPAAVGTVNTSTDQCPECHAPAGKPHGSKCSVGLASNGTAPTSTTGVTLPPGPKRGFGGGESKNQPSTRQIKTAQLMGLGQALYEGAWDETRAALVTQLGVQSGSAADLTESQLDTLIAKLKDAAIEATLGFAGQAGWTEETAEEKLKGFGYKQVGTWDGDVETLPVKFVVKLFEAAIKDAAEV